MRSFLGVLLWFLISLLYEFVFVVAAIALAVTIFPVGEWIRYAEELSPERLVAKTDTLTHPLLPVNVQLAPNGTLKCYTDAGGDIKVQQLALVDYNMLLVNYRRPIHFSDLTDAGVAICPDALSLTSVHDLLFHIGSTGQ
jgi:hypothetical protein